MTDPDGVPSALPSAGSAPVSAAPGSDSEPQLNWEEDRPYVWQHVLHEDNVFNALLNFFLVFESLSLAGFITLVTSDLDPGLWALPLAGLGVLTSLMWMYVQRRSVLILGHPVKALEAKDSYYKWLRYHRQKDFPRIFRMRNWQVLGIVVPMLFLFIWIVTGLLALGSRERREVGVPACEASFGKPARPDPATAGGRRPAGAVRVRPMRLPLPLSSAKRYQQVASRAR